MVILSCRSRLPYYSEERDAAAAPAKRCSRPRARNVYDLHFGNHLKGNRNTRNYKYEHVQQHNRLNYVDELRNVPYFNDGITRNSEN